MVGGFFKKAGVYLGIVDDEYDDEYDDYGSRPPVTEQVVAREPEEPQHVPAPAQVAATIRPIARDEPTQAMPATATAQRSSSVRPFVAEASAKVHVIAPTEFGDARLIAERLMSNQPVIVNLQVADVQLMRRMIDFCSGVTFALSGKMERVADRVFLMTPSNVKVSAEERQRLQENGLLRP